ncbi:MAG: ABC transporter substrate-binding protein [Acidimicrobiia bacterium]
MKKRWRIALVSVSLALVAAACGGSSDGGSDTGSDAASDVSAGALPKATSTSAAAEESFDENATLRFAYRVSPTTGLDPAKASSSFDMTTLALVYDRLVHVNNAGDPEPGLAESWSFVDGDTALELKLRPDVVFQDGEPFTADAVKISLDRNRGATFEQSAVKSDLAMVESVEVVDPLTVKLVFKAGVPGGPLPLVLSDRAGMIASPKALQRPDFDQVGGGAGMYKPVEFIVANKLVAERWDGYWAPETVKAARVELTFNPDSNTRLNGLRSGQFDIVDIDPAQRAEADSAGLATIGGKSLIFYHLHLNRADPQVAKKEVRQALNMAIDREALVQAMTGGEGEPGVQPFPEGYWAYNPDIPADTYQYDPEGAKALLAAGVPEGYKLPAIVSALPVNTQIAEIVKAQLSDVGLDLELLPTQAEQVPKALYTDKLGLGVVPWGGRADPAQTTNALYTAAATTNPGGHSTPRVEELQLAAAQPGDPADRAAAMHELVKEITDEALDVVLYYPYNPYAMSDKVSGMEVWITGKPEFRNVGILR